jgi:hypothetical protein
MIYVNVRSIARLMVALFCLTTATVQAHSQEGLKTTLRARPAH